MDLRELLTEPGEVLRWGVALAAAVLAIMAAGLDVALGWS